MKKYKKILLVAPHYFNYDLIIKEHLEKKGFLVDLINDRPYDSNIFKAIVRINRSIISSFLFLYYQNKILKTRTHVYHVIFIIQGEGLVPAFLKWLRHKYKGTPMVCYLWDSVMNKPMIKENFPYFDRVITFDSDDAKRFRLDFVPLFFSPEFDIASTKTKINKFDLCFIGSLHTDRAQLIQNLKNNIPLLNFFIYLYAPSRIIFYLRSFFLKEFFFKKLSDLHFNKLSHSQIMAVLKKSTAILDIHSANQSGLTMRTIEALALQKKIVTTNTNIKNYDFYLPENICVLDRKKLSIPITFLRTPFKP
jgi:hypothetical protein